MKIVFMGTPDFAAGVLQKLILEGFEVVLAVSQPDRPVGRKREWLPTPVKKVALAHEIPVFQPEQIKKDHAAILATGADLIVTAAYGQILPTALLEAPRLGAINVHASLLPKYRGGAPIHQAIVNGESETGITIMYMEETMDTGDVIVQESLPIEETDDVGTLFEKLSVLGANLLAQTLPDIQTGAHARTPQDHSKATYASNITRADERLDWSKPAKALFNQIRGLNPWPTAYTTLHEANVKCFASQVSKQTSDLKPGTIVQVSANGIDVACGDGSVLSLLQLQLAGKKRMPLKDLLNGEHPFKTGAKFEH